MAENSAISWCDDTFNPWIGCTKVSPACDGCYAENLMATRYGRVQWGAPGRGEGTRQRTSAGNWAKPLKWEREQAEAWTAWSENGHAPPEPSRFVFCASLADVFDNAVPVEWRQDLFRLIFQTPSLTWLLLTKRPGNILPWVRAQLNDDRPQVMSHCWPRNAAIGCTVVTQAEADRDIPKLLAAKAALNPAFAFVSMEPLLAPVDLTRIQSFWGNALNGLTGRWSVSSEVGSDPTLPGLDWVITGGETDQGSHKARPSHPDWFRSLRDQCAAAGVAYHHKQNGEWAHSEDRPPPTPVAKFFDGEGNPAGDGWHFWTDGDDGANASIKVGKKAAGRALDGVIHDARPRAAG